MSAIAMSEVPRWLETVCAGGESVLVTDTSTLRFYAQDVYAEGAPLAAVVQPQTVAALDRLVRAASDAGCALLPRGGGLSYTNAYLAEHAGAVLVDLAALNRIETIVAADRYVIAEAGVTWAALDAALAEHGLRTPYWGPLSGLRATIGGALSQGSVFLGSGLHGAVGDSVLALEVATPRGLLRTGAWAASGTAPFLRWYGPDLTGLLIGDAGSLGIKARVSLRLLPRPRVLGFASAAFGSAVPMLGAMAEVSRQALASECFGFDPVLARMRLKRASLMADAKTLGAVVRKQGLVEGLKLVAAGREFLEAGEWSAHAVVEAAEPAELAARLARVRKLFADAGGRAIDDSIPKVLRATPFTPPNTILGPDGERWVPVHGIVPHSQAAATFAALAELFAAACEECARHAVEIGYLFTTVAQQGSLIEPVFYWPDSHTEYHRRVVEAAYLARIGTREEERPAARALVARLKRAASDCLRAHGAVHFQLGRWYAWRQGRDPIALALYDALKQQLDPRGVLNPGVLR